MSTDPLTPELLRDNPLIVRGLVPANALVHSLLLASSVSSLPTKAEIQRLRAIIAAQREIASAPTELPALLEWIAARMRALVGADGAAIAWPEGDHLMVRAATGRPELPAGTSISLTNTLAGRCARTGEVVHVVAPDPRLEAEAWISSAAAILVPLACTEAGLAVLGVTSEHVDRLGAAEREALEQLAPLLTAAVRTASLAAGKEALRQSEQNLRTLTEGSPDPILVHRFGPICYVNPAAVAYLGFSRREELLGTKVTDHFHPEERSPRLALLEALRIQGVVPPRMEHRLVHKDGTVMAAEVNTQEIGFEGQRAVLLVIRDVTERKALEAKLLIADRMATLGTLAAGVAHEINNPLAYVSANLNYVREELARFSDRLPEESRQELCDALAEATEGTARVTAIVQDLKTTCRSDEPRVALVEVKSALESALKMTTGEIRRRARLVVQLDEVSPVRADVSRLAQVFLNLLTNALQAIPDGAADHHEIRVTLREERGTVIAEVSDSGPGIPPELMGRIFDPFFTTKPVGVGTGLGLSICHGIVTSFGGRIVVESEPGRGALFRVALPAARPEREIALAAAG